VLISWDAFERVDFSPGGSGPAYGNFPPGRPLTGSVTTRAGREERGAQRARVTLHSGEELQLERTGDLGEGNAGMLIFVDGRERPEYVPWTDVEQVDFDRPTAIYPPLGER